MKRIFTGIAALVFCLSICASTALAAAPAQTTEQIEYYEDGSFLTITTTLYPTISRASERYAEKEYKYTDNTGDAAYTYTLRGWFTYDLISSEAVRAAAVIHVHKSGWTVSSHSEYCSGSTAYGNVTFKGPLFVTRSINATLTCDRYGNID